MSSSSSSSASAQKAPGSRLKGFKSQNKLDESTTRRILDDLKHAIHEIHNQNASLLSFEELYRNAYNLVLHKHGDKLYSMIEQLVREHLSQLGGTVAAASDEALLGELVDKWRTHMTTMTMIRDILMYMDRTFVEAEKREPVYQLGLRVFREQVARHPLVKGRVRSALLGAVERERRGELIDRDATRNVLQMLVDLGAPPNGAPVYEEDFERPFLAATQSFFQQEALAFVQVNTCPDFLVKAEARLEEERGRAHAYLNSSTEDKLLKLVADEMVARHAAVLVQMPNSGCRVLLRDDKLADLARMYRLFAVRGCRDEIRACMAELARETGERLVEAEGADQNPVDFVRDLLELQDKYDRVVREAFLEDKLFHKSLKDAFEFFINKNQRCAQYLSLYLDDLMKNRVKALAEEQELGTRVDRVIVLFRYLHDKDVFESFYKSHLAKRLLSGRSVSEDAESVVIKKLKTECGYLFTSKLEGMFKDIRLSKETMDKFNSARPRGVAGAAAAGAGARAAAATASSSSSSSSAAAAAAAATTAEGRSAPPAPELGVTVLTAGFWPTESAKPCNLPADVTPICENFATFYLGCHSGRRLTYQTNLGSADLRAAFASGRTHEFNVSTYQMCALMLFAPPHVQQLSFSEIAQATAVPEQELKRHLISLVAPKFKILNKEPKGKTLEPDSVFTVNNEYTSKAYRVKVPLVSSRENLDGRAPSVPEQVEEDRRHLIEAAIVRIMKARKTLEHNLLIAEVHKQMSVRFQPSPQQIKKRIESLIEREYLERSAQDRKMLSYLA